MIGFLNCDKEIINHIKKVLMPDNVLFISKDETKDYLKTKDFANYVYQRQINGKHNHVLIEFSFYELLTDIIYYNSRAVLDIGGYTSTYKQEILELTKMYRKALVITQTYNLENLIQNEDNYNKIIRYAFINFLISKMHLGDIIYINEELLPIKTYEILNLLRTRS